MFSDDVIGALDCAKESALDQFSPKKTKCWNITLSNGDIFRCEADSISDAIDIVQNKIENNKPKIIGANEYE